MQDDLDELRKEYLEAVEVERIAHRQLKNATCALLDALGIPARNTTLRSASDQSLTWYHNAGAFRPKHLSPSKRKLFRTVRKMSVT